MVLLKEDATTLDQIRSLFQAEYTRFLQESSPGMSPETLVAESLRYTKATFPSLVQRLTEAGWNLSTPHMSAGEARIVDKTKVK